MGKLLTLVFGGALAGLALLSGGQAPRDNVVDSPIVTYAYAGDHGGDLFAQAMAKAED